MEARLSLELGAPRTVVTYLWESGCPSSLRYPGSPRHAFRPAGPFNQKTGYLKVLRGDPRVPNK